MIISDLTEMEARVDVGEMDVVDIKPGQKATLDVDAFKDRKFNGVVTDVASASKDNSSPQGVSSGGGQTQEATKFQVRIRISDTEEFRPGMSVSANIETSYRTNALTVPLASVTTRAVSQVASMADPPAKSGTNKIASATNAATVGTNALAAGTNSVSGTNSIAHASGFGEMSKLQDVVFVMEGDHVKAVPVKIGICDDNYWEITTGLTNGQEIVSGGYRAISRDLKDGSKVKKGLPVIEAAK